MIDLFRETLIFAAVMVVVCNHLLGNVDETLRNCFDWCWMHLQRWACPSLIADTAGCVSSCLSNICRCCFCGFSPRWGQAFHGATFLGVFFVFFAILEAPFRMWTYGLDAEFGFVNTVEVTSADFRLEVVRGIGSQVLGRFPGYVFLLVVLQSRCGWFMLWTCLVMAVVFAQYSMSELAPSAFGENVFPKGDFAVGRHFPTASAGHNRGRERVSLNRIYFSQNSSFRLFKSNDESTNQVELAALAENLGDMGRWELRERHANLSQSHAVASEVDESDYNELPETYAVTQAEDVFHNDSSDLRRLSDLSWIMANSTAAEAGRVGVRHGGQLRSKLFGFADEHNISIGEVYMVDGSHEDLRANAFVAGAGSGRVIGLYDTLFLGARAGADEEGGVPGRRRPVGLVGLHGAHGGSLSIQGLGEGVQGVRVPPSEEEEDGLWHSEPAEAMDDDEIAAIMGHELGHSALRHVEKAMAAQAAGAFCSFALLGWMAQSQLLAKGLAVPFAAAPHVGLLLHRLVAGGTLESVLKLGTNAQGRHDEFQADVFSAETSEAYAAALQSALVKLARNSNQDPHVPWFYEALHHNHPTLARRWAAIERVKSKNGWSTR